VRACVCVRALCSLRGGSWNSRNRTAQQVTQPVKGALGWEFVRETQFPVFHDFFAPFVSQQCGLKRFLCLGENETPAAFSKIHEFLSSFIYYKFRSRAKPHVALVPVSRLMPEAYCGCLFGRFDFTHACPQIQV